MYDVDRFPAMSWRRRLLVLVCALGTAYLILSHVMGRPGAADFKPPPQPDRQRCTAGQTTACVGGVAAVIVAPASQPAASASASAARP